MEINKALLETLYAQCAALNKTPWFKTVGDLKAYLRPVLLGAMLFRAHAEQVRNPQQKRSLEDAADYFEDIVMTLVKGLAERGLLDSDGMIRVPEPGSTMLPRDVNPTRSLADQLHPIVKRLNTEFERGSEDVSRRLMRGEIDEAKAEEILARLRAKVRKSNPVIFDDQLNAEQIELDPICADPDARPKPDDDDDILIIE